MIVFELWFAFVVLRLANVGFIWRFNTSLLIIASVFGLIGVMLVVTCCV